MKRRSFLAMLGLAPTVAVAASTAAAPEPFSFVDGVLTQKQIKARTISADRLKLGGISYADLAPSGE